jgi:23S rRNA pseudouridine1911/1915/1917 synthase
VGDNPPDEIRSDEIRPDEIRRFVARQPEPRADRFLAQELGWSRSRVKVLFDEERVARDDAPIRARDALDTDAVLVVRIAPERELAPLAQEAIDVPILYQDDAVVVVNKPADLVVHPARGHASGTLVNAFVDRVEEGMDAERPGIVHRLDKGTSGVLVIARTREAMQALQIQFEEHTVERRYYALVWGRVRDLSGTIDQALARHPKDRLKFAVSDRGRRAVTHWRRLAQADTMALLECRLETGRTHQVRVHLQHLGNPVVGDPLYRPRGTPVGAVRAEHQMLHAFRLAFDHPRSRERVSFEAPPPEDFRAVAAAAGVTYFGGT